jgi:transposase-like protein
MSESRTRRTFSPSQKAQVVRRHLVGKAAVSDLADELGVQPSQIHLWVKQLLDQAERAFERSAGAPRQSRRAENAKDQRIEQLEAKLADKNEVIAELMEENVRAKKANGEL